MTTKQLNQYLNESGYEKKSRINRLFDLPLNINVKDLDFLYPCDDWECYCKEMDCPVDCWKCPTISKTVKNIHYTLEDFDLKKVIFFEAKHDDLIEMNELGYDTDIINIGDLFTVERLENLTIKIRLEDLKRDIVVWADGIDVSDMEQE